MIRPSGELGAPVKMEAGPLGLLKKDMAIITGGEFVMIAIEVGEGISKRIVSGEL